MSPASRSDLWKELKEAGVEMPLHYREYSTEALQKAVDMLHKTDAPAPEEPSLGDVFEGLQETEPIYSRAQPPKPEVKVTSEKDEFAGMQTRGQDEWDPIRIDPDTGFIWYRDEVRKAATAKPRARKIIRYNDTGVKTVQMKAGEYTESFELPGNESRISEARITLPSYQTGIYRETEDSPFRIHVYGDQRGFNLFDVENYYGGPEKVPSGIRRIYVSNDLCYDMRSVIQAIENEYRERFLQRGATI